MPDVDLGDLKARTIALDFDGPVHSYVSGWTGEVPMDPPTPGSREIVEALVDAGAEVVIVTTRAQTVAGCEGTIAWLHHYGYPPLKVTDKKVPAVAYIDDRAVHFDPAHPDWLHVLTETVRLAVRSHTPTTEEAATDD